MSSSFIYLASGSPRRRELLDQIGVNFQVLNVSVDETRWRDEVPHAYVSRIARLKAEAGLRARPAMTENPVLAADTTVVLEGAILGKPESAADAARMLCELSGRTHQVLTAIALTAGRDLLLRVVASDVTFREISAAEAAAYWATGEPRDKAGGYAIQGRAAVFVAALRGSYSGVMGLPLFETAELLTQAGLCYWSGAA